MLKFEHTEVVGWKHAIRGMRNPLESWEKSDSNIGFGTAFALIAHIRTKILAVRIVSIWERTTSIS